MDKILDQDLSLKLDRKTVKAICFVDPKKFQVVHRVFSMLLHLILIMLGLIQIMV